MERLNEHGYKNMWPTWIHHNLTPKHNCLIVVQQIEKLLLDR